jgi:succinate-semialdehyde dehydrogenase/glutarate-semialdehyde dehydrogenase
MSKIQLQDRSLLRDKAYVGGRWIGADGGQSFSVRNPADDGEITKVPDLGVAETHRAIEAAGKAYPAWRAKTAKERAVILRKWYVIIENKEDLAVLMTSEQGKALAESRGEVVYGASFIEWFGRKPSGFMGTSSRRTSTAGASSC